MEKNLQYIILWKNIMTSKNDITGDSIKTKHNNKKYRDNFVLVFNKKAAKIKRAESIKRKKNENNKVL